MRAHSITWLSLGCLACSLSCSGSQTSTEAPKNGEGTEAKEAIPITPEKEGPDGLSDGEKGELGAKCNAVEPDMYDANKQAIATLQEELGKGEKSEAAEKKGLDAGVTMFKSKAKGLDGTDMARCLALFEKRTRRALFDFEPAEEVARDTVETCVKRVHATVGKANMAYDMGGSGTETSGQGPFCPDDDPVPPSLKNLPYKSSSEDWDTPAFKCLSFGLRAKQDFQFEYTAPYGTNEFQCIARFLPRQGGAPIELVQGGRVTQGGELEIEEKITRRRMKRD